MRKAAAIFGLDMPTTRMQSDVSPSAGLMAERDIHLMTHVIIVIDRIIVAGNDPNVVWVLNVGWLNF